MLVCFFPFVNLPYKFVKINSLAFTMLAYLIAIRETQPFYIALEFHKSYVDFDDFSELTKRRKTTPEYEKKVQAEV